jgi:hypothetical protein
MSHRRSLRWAGFGLALLAPAVGCLVSGNGEPGPAFDNGSRHHPSSVAGTTGTRDAGSAGTIGHDGGGDAKLDAGVDGVEGGSDATTDGATTDATTTDATTTEGGTDARPSACVAGSTATFTFSWTVEDATGTTSTCSAQGGQTVDLEVVNLSTGAESLTTAPCATMTATTCPLPGGDYSVSMKLRNATGTVLAEVDAPMLFLSDGEATPVASVPFEVGGADAANGRGIAFTWSIENQSSRAAETCAQASATTVRVVAGTKTFDLTCTDGKGRTTTLAPGDYAVTLHLQDAQGADLSVTQTMTLHVSAGQLLFLGNVVFDVI